MAKPRAGLEIDHNQGTGPRVRVVGSWTLSGIGGMAASLEHEAHAAGPEAHWRLDEIERLDSVGALILWRAWGGAKPPNCALRPEHDALFAQLPAKVDAGGTELYRRRRRGLGWLGAGTGALLLGLVDAVALFGQLVLDTLYLMRHPRELPWRELSATIYKAGVRAMPVAALVGFLIGVVLSYLSSLQLRNFGADLYIVNILGLGTTRELGPVLVAVLVAGRSGSAMAAQIGVMRVTEEIDALAVMGISRSQRLVLPKILALALAMPLLVLWTTAMALLGGMVSAYYQLDISYAFFIDQIPRVVPVANLVIGLSKGVVFGILIAAVACYFGLRVRPNTESLSACTTSSVVVAITVVILVDAIFAIATRNIGVPG